MQSVVLVIMCVATLLDFVLGEWKAAPAFFKLIPEMFTVVVTLFVLAEGVRKGFGNVAAKYWIVFGVISFVMLCSILTNSVGAGPVFTGMRTYFRAIPMFLLPGLYAFSDKQLQQQLKLLLGIGLLQLPIASYQRWTVWYEGHFSGDAVVGTLAESGVLSIVLICMTLIVTGLFIRKRIKFAPFLALFFLLMFPTTINETKATVLLFPPGLLAVIVMGSPHGKRLRNFALAMGLLITFGAIMVPVYDAMQANSPYKNERHLMDFFTNQQQFDRYMVTKKQATVGTTAQVGRGDAINVPLHYISQDVVHLAFGLGVGNVTHSNLGESFTGKYFQLFQSFTYTGFAVFILELGLLGTALVFFLYWFAFADALAVARADNGLIGAFSVGWIGCVVVMAFCTFYTTTQVYVSMSYLYWFFAGVVAARRVQLQHQAQAAKAATRSPRPALTTQKKAPSIVSARSGVRPGI